VLEQNYRTPSTVDDDSVRFARSLACNLAVFNMLGQEWHARTGEQDAGNRSIVFDARALQRIYFYRITAGISLTQEICFDEIVYLIQCRGQLRLDALIRHAFSVEFSDIWRGSNHALLSSSGNRLSAVLSARIPSCGLPVGFAFHRPL